jgi:hypothetical protein
LSKKQEFADLFHKEHKEKGGGEIILACLCVLFLHALSALGGCFACLAAKAQES